MYQRLLTIASIPSISRSCTEEDKVLRILFDEIAKSAYFKEHPEDLCLLPAESDPLKRNFLFAIVRTPERTEKTVLLTGHIDVVGVSDYGSLQNLAFLPERYTAALKGASLDEDSLKDLRSGKWLFGRGVGDMKSGVAAGVELLLNAAESCQNLASNLAVLFVSDEETSSAGMLGAVPWLAKLQDEGLRFICCIDLLSVLCCTVLRYSHETSFQFENLFHFTAGNFESQPLFKMPTRTRDFHPLENAHAGQTKRLPGKPS